MKTWERGPREMSLVKNSKGNPTPLLGKKGGPVIKQEVVLVIDPN